MKIGAFDAAEFPVPDYRVASKPRAIPAFVPRFVRNYGTKVGTFRASLGTKVIPGFVPSPIHDRAIIYTTEISNYVTQSYVRCSSQYTV